MTDAGAPLDWQTDVPLAEDVRRVRPLAPQAHDPRVALVTGATGLLGAHVVDELLRTGCAEVVGLVRDADGEPGATRLRAHLERLGLGRAAADVRLTALPGDLAEPRLGLSDAAFAALAGRVDAIYHCGAQTNFLRPYAALRPTNVLGTAEVLRLAALGPTKPVHHVSSLALFFGPAGGAVEQVSELDAPTPSAALRSGYVQSKWAAERLVTAARERGLPTAIYRTSRISGHSRTGATSSPGDLLNALLRACVLLGAYPTLGIDVAMTPVDHVSRAMVYLSRLPRSIGRAFHLLQPEPIAWSALLRKVAALGYPMDALDYPAWRSRLKQAAAHGREREALGRLWVLLGSDNALLAPRPRHDLPNSRELLAESGIVCPPIDDALVGAAIGFLRASGYLPPPAAAQNA